MTTAAPLKHPEDPSRILVTARSVLGSTRAPGQPFFFFFPRSKLCADPRQMAPFLGPWQDSSGSTRRTVDPGVDLAFPVAARWAVGSPRGLPEAGLHQRTAGFADKMKLSSLGSLEWYECDDGKGCNLKLPSPWGHHTARYVHTRPLGEAYVTCSLYPRQLSSSAKQLLVFCPAPPPEDLSTRDYSTRRPNAGRTG